MAIYAPPAWQADPAKVKRIMVGGYGDFYVFEHRDPRGVPLNIVNVLHDAWYEGEDSLSTLATLAFDNHCGAVWIIDDMCRLEVPRNDMRYTWHELSSGGAVAGAVAQVRGGNGEGKGMPLAIYTPLVNDAWGIAGAMRGVGEYALAEGVALAAFALGQQLRFSPSYTGNAILRRVLADYERRTGTTIPQPSQATRELCMEHRPSPVQWRTSLPLYDPALDTGEDITIHIYDRNMSYVSSAREVPVGDPIPTKEFHRGCPGVYLVMDLLHPDQVKWAWEPELRAIIDNDPDTDLWEVLEGYYWPKTAKLDLRLWQDRIWDARRAARGVDSLAGRIAEAIIKKAGVAAIGRFIQHTGRAVVSSAQAQAEGLRILSHESDDMGELTGNVEAEMAIGRDDLLWPHVWGTIISSANERLWHAIATYAPHDTILAYVDQFYCLSRHPDLDEKCDPMKVGGWKYSGFFRVPVSHLEELNQMNAQQLVKAFAAYQRAEVK